MPIEIRELIIKAAVIGDEKAGGSISASSGNTDNPREEIINACVEKVIQILKEKNER